jgi:paraquat-inducible protein A
MTEPVLVARPDLVVCDECDAVHERIELASGTVARCRRCNALLGRGRMLHMQALLAFSIGALVLMVVANSAPIVTLDLRGVVSQATLPDSIQYTWESGQPLVALLTAATVQVFPLVFTLLRIYLLVSLMQGLVPRGFAPAMRALDFVTRWSMVEVFMMGTVVAVVRGATLTSATPGIGLFAYGALALLLTAITAAGTHSMWKRGAALGSIHPEGAAP